MRGIASSADTSELGRVNGAGTAVSFRMIAEDAISGAAVLPTVSVLAVV